MSEYKEGKAWELSQRHVEANAEMVSARLFADLNPGDMEASKELQLANAEERCAGNDFANYMTSKK